MRILVVTYYHDPVPAAGTARWPAMARHLRARGHEVTILTTGAFGSLPDDRSRHVVRSGDLNGSPFLRRLLRRPPISTKPGGAATGPPPPALLTSVMVPDTYLVSWVPWALARAAALVREQRIDAVVTSSPTESTHVVGLALRRRVDCWLADFRDGWVVELSRPELPTAAQRRASAWLEGHVVETADAVTAVTRPIVDDLSERYRRDVAHVPNGWDPQLESEVDAAPLPSIEPGTFTLVHSGKLSGAWGRRPDRLFEALALLRERDPAASRIRLLLAGHLDPDEHRLLERSSFDGMVRHLGNLDRRAAVALQRRADALLLVTSPRHRSEATSKLCEYLAAGRPIVALARDNEAARVIRETGTGVAVAPDDPEEIAGALASALSGDLERAYSPRNLETYTYPQPAAALAAALEQGFARRRGEPPSPVRKRFSRPTRRSDDPRVEILN